MPEQSTITQAPPATAITPAPTAPEPPKSKPALSATLMQQHEYNVPHSWLVIPGEYDYEDLLKPATWVHIAGRCKVYQILTCISDTGKFDVDLRVVEATGKMIAVRPIRVMLYSGEDQKTYGIAEDAFEIRHIPNKGYGARNKFEGTWLFQGKVSRDEAHKALKAHLEAQKKN